MIWKRRRRYRAHLRSHREKLDRQELTVSSSPPVLADAHDLEKAVAIPSPPSLAPEQLDRQELTVSSSPPVLADAHDLEKAAAIPSSPSLAPGTTRSARADGLIQSTGACGRT